MNHDQDCERRLLGASKCTCEPRLNDPVAKLRRLVNALKAADELAKASMKIYGIVMRAKAHQPIGLRAKSLDLRELGASLTAYGKVRNGK